MAIVGVRDIVERALDDFDFEKAHKMMAAVDWKTAQESGEYRVATPDDLRISATAMLGSLLSDEKIKSVSSGGLRVVRDEDGGAYIEFVCKTGFLV